MDNKKEIILVRHGECIEKGKKIFVGQMNLDLTAEGYEKTKKLAEERVCEEKSVNTIFYDITGLKVPFGMFSPCFIYNNNYRCMSRTGGKSACETKVNSLIPVVGLRT